jgi:hypothetical protein
MYMYGGGGGRWQVYWSRFFLWLLSVGFVIVEDNQLGLSIYEVEWLTLVDFEEWKEKLKTIVKWESFDNPFFACQVPMWRGCSSSSLVREEESSGYAPPRSSSS